MKLKNVLLLILIAGSFVSCRKDNTGIPVVNVNIYINTLDPQYQNLNGLGSWAYVNGGSKGIIVFKSDANQYRAYERHCTFESSNACSIVNVESNNLMATDTCCGSKFQLLDGQPVDGPASIGLRQYNTSFDGNIIHIWN